MEIITRKDMGWPATPARERITNAGMVIHYDGGARGKPRVSADKPCSNCKSYWEWCRDFHMGPSRKWKDVGYCAFMCPHGNLYIGRDYGHEQAAQPGGNMTWASLTLGLVVGQEPTDAQIQGVRRVRKMWMDKGMHATIRCHSQFYSTSCPGDILRTMVNDGTFTKNPIDDWTEELMSNLPMLSEGADNYHVKTVRALLVARAFAKDIDPGKLLDWINTTKFNRDLTAHVMAFQQAKFPKTPKDWDGIVGEKTWGKLYAP